AGAEAVRRTVAARASHASVPAGAGGGYAIKARTKVTPEAGDPPDRLCAAPATAADGAAAAPATAVPTPAAAAPAGPPAPPAAPPRRPPAPPPPPGKERAAGGPPAGSARGGAPPPAAPAAAACNFMGTAGGPAVEAASAARGHVRSAGCPRAADGEE